jgi:hypothetical protein
MNEETWWLDAIKRWFPNQVSSVSQLIVEYVDPYYEGSSHVRVLGDETGKVISCSSLDHVKLILMRFRFAKDDNILFLCIVDKPLREKTQKLVQKAQLIWRPEFTRGRVKSMKCNHCLTFSRKQFKGEDSDGCSSADDEPAFFCSPCSQILRAYVLPGRSIRYEYDRTDVVLILKRPNTVAYKQFGYFEKHIKKQD